MKRKPGKKGNAFISPSCLQLQQICLDAKYQIQYLEIKLLEICTIHRRLLCSQSLQASMGAMTFILAKFIGQPILSLLNHLAASVQLNWKKTTPRLHHQVKNQWICKTWEKSGNWADSQVNIKYCISLGGCWWAQLILKKIQRFSPKGVVCCEHLYPEHLTFSTSDDEQIPVCIWYANLMSTHILQRSLTDRQWKQIGRMVQSFFILI